MTTGTIEIRYPTLAAVEAAGVARLSEILDDERLAVFSWLCGEGAERRHAYECVVSDRFYPTYRDRYRALVERNAAKTRAWEEAIAFQREHDARSKYVCWACRTKFEAFEKDAHICPSCGTDLDAD